MIENYLSKTALLFLVQLRMYRQLLSFQIACVVLWVEVGFLGCHGEKNSWGPPGRTRFRGKLYWWCQIRASPLGPSSVHPAMAESSLPSAGEKQGAAQSFRSVWKPSPASANWLCPGCSPAPGPAGLGPGGGWRAPAVERDHRSAWQTSRTLPFQDLVSSQWCHLLATPLFPWLDCRQALSTHHPNFTAQAPISPSPRGPHGVDRWLVLGGRKL